MTVPKAQVCSIVVLGSFNPPIFQPWWFADKGLIQKDEAKDANVEIVHRSITQFALPWAAVQVTENRFSIDSSDSAKQRPLRDLVHGTFSILEHTPVVAFGFNLHDHFQTSSEDEWNRMGHQLVPKSPFEGVIENPGTRLVVVDGTRKDSQSDRIQVRVGPSDKIDQGVLVHVNQHYSLDARDEEDKMPFFLDELQESWDHFLRFGRDTSATVFARLKGETQ